MSPPLRYRFAGIEIESWLPLRELDPGSAALPDVRIVRAPVPRPPGTVTPVGYYAELANGAVLEIPDCARFAITDGKTITVELLGDPDPHFLRLYLLGSVLGALLHQRGVLPLHAGTVAFAGGAVALVGESGAGKSTLTALLSAAGAAYLADDVSPIEVLSSGAPSVWPGVNRLRVTPEVCGGVGLDTRAAYLDPFGKLVFDPPWLRPSAQVRLRGVLILRMDDALAEPQLTRATPREVLGTLIAHTYRPEFIPADRRGAHLRTCAGLASRLPGWHFVRPSGLSRAGKDAVALMGAIGSLSG